ncbi:hypothetical protein MRX96_026333 [Rhipicephalus microplus]
MASGHQLIYIEYNGIVRQCRNCFRPGHISTDYVMPCCERCGKYGDTMCEQKCQRCGGDHARWARKARAFSYAAAASASSSSQVRSSPADDREVPGRGPPVGKWPPGGGKPEGVELEQA